MAATVVDAGPHQVSRSIVVDASAAELFDMVADPRRHGELDGSGTVRATVSGPERLAQGAAFSVNMKRLGVPYRITSTVTGFEDGRLIEWRHPAGHRWRWEFAPRPDGSTLVTETFDFSKEGVGKAKITFFRLTGAPKTNATGIEATLTRLRTRYAG